MIFPKKLEYVTFYLPEAQTYYELAVSSSQLRFNVEPFYSREAISAKKSFSIRGIRFNLEINFDQTRQHQSIVNLWNDIYAEPDNKINLYLRKQDEITAATDYFEVLTGDFTASTSYRNTINRGGYNMSFTSVITDFGIGLVYLVDVDEVVILNNDSEKMLVNLVNY